MSSPVSQWYVDLHSWLHNRQLILQEARAIGERLSATEKIELIEWLRIQLCQEVNTSQSAIEADAPTRSDEFPNGHDNTQYDATGSAALIPSVDEVPPTWTDEEIRVMMRPNPKTGAEIAAMLESGEIDTSVGAELEIADVVTWLEDLRRRERIERGLEE